MLEKRGGPRLGPNDWECTKQRWRAFWQFDVFDRPILRMTAPANRKTLPEELGYRPAWDDTPEKEWADMAQILLRNRYDWSNTVFYGDAFAALDHKWSLAQALPFGCTPHYNAFAAWCEPVPLVGGDYPPVYLDKGGAAWSWMMESTALACKESKGDYFVRTDWGNFTGDTLCAIRGDMNLMIDLAENRSHLLQAAQATTKGLLEIYRELYRITREQNGMDGSINYLSCWSDKKTMALDCDISCMISSTDFKDFFLPGLADAAESVDNTIYHLDGPGAIRHLDALLDLSDIHGIQWVPGAGHEEIEQWLDLLRYIQSHKKGLLIQIQPEEIPLIQKNLSPQGLAVSIYCDNETKAERCLQDWGKWTRTN